MTRVLLLFAATLCCVGCQTSRGGGNPATTPNVQLQKNVSKREAAQAAQKDVEAIRAGEASIAAPPRPEAPAVRPEAPAVIRKHERAPSPGAATPQSADNSLQTQVENWFANLSQGKIQYKVPVPMFWKEASTVTVVVEGPQAPASDEMSAPTGSAALKVSNRMKVVIASPDNPDEFTIAPEEGTSDIQFVPANGSTTWNWTVTPRYTGSSQRLQISAWVLYPGQDDKILLQLPVYTATVDVHVPGFGEALKRLLEGDPDYWLKYGLPGGGGFVFVAGVFTWFFNRKSKRKEKSS